MVIELGEGISGRDGVEGHGGGWAAVRLEGGRFAAAAADRQIDPAGPLCVSDGVHARPCIVCEVGIIEGATLGCKTKRVPPPHPREIPRNYLT